MAESIKVVRSRIICGWGGRAPPEQNRHGSVPNPRKCSVYSCSGTIRGFVSLLCRGSSVVERYRSAQPTACTRWTVNLQVVGSTPTSGSIFPNGDVVKWFKTKALQSLMRFPPTSQVRILPSPPYAPMDKRSKSPALQAGVAGSNPAGRTI